jgi:type I restriction enzyme M protein
MSEKANTEQILDEVWSRLWAGGVSDPMIAIEQIAYFLLLKRVDLTQPRLSDGREPATSSFRRAPWLRWAVLRTLADDELLSRLEKHLLPFISSTAAGPTFEQAMAGGRLALTDPDLIRACISAVDQLEFAATDLDRQGTVFDTLLGQLQLSGLHGQLRTPPALRRTMIELLDPRPSNVVCDPASGTGGLLVEVHTHLRRAGLPPRAVELCGFDVNEGMVRLGALNLLFHGVPDPLIRQADSLAAGFDPPKADIVVTNPPFGDNFSGSRLDTTLVAGGNRSELLFLERARQLLRQGGSAAVLIPQAVLFGKTADFVNVRRNWLQRGNVHAVISLPAGMLEPYSSVRTAIFFASNWGETGEVLFCQVPDQLRDQGEDPDADQLSAIAPAIRARLNGVKPAGAAAADVAANIWSAGIEEIRQNHWSLLPSAYLSPEAIKQRQHDPLDLLQQIEAGQTEIDQRLSEARRLLREA